MKQLIRYLVGKEKVDPTKYTTCQQQIDNPVYQTLPHKSLPIGMGESFGIWLIWNYVIRMFSGFLGYSHTLETIQAGSASMIFMNYIPKANGSIIHILLSILRNIIAFIVITL